MAQTEKQDVVEEYKTLWGARILWPPDIPDDMLEDAVKQALAGLEQYPAQEDGIKLAEQMKRYFDEKWGPYWHIVAGRNFGCHAVHEKQRFVYFYIGQVAFMLYKSS